MKKLVTLAFLAFTLTAGAQEMIINKTDGSIMDKLSMKELYKTTHISDDGGNKQVKIELANGAIYTCDINDFDKATITTKDDMLKKGRYANMTLVKTFDSVDDLEEGDLIGIVDDADYDFDEYLAHAYCALSDTTTDWMAQEFEATTRTTLFNAIKIACLTNLNTLALKNLVLASNIRFHVTDIVYVGKDIDGTNIPLSARLIYPYHSTDASRLAVTNLYVEQHTTLTQDGREPSVSFYPFSCSGIVFNGYMVIQPDLLGFGISNMRSQMFVNSEINGAGTADCIIAAKQFIDLTQDGTKYKTVNLSDDATIISAGSSQGASTALGFTYYMENKLPKDVADNLPKVSENHLCAGAYNPLKTFETFVENDSVEGLLLPLIANTAIVARPDYMTYSDGNKMLPYDFLVPELKDKTWSGLTEKRVPENMTIWQILNSKKSDFDVFETVFTQDYPYDPNPSYSSFEKIIAKGITKLGEDGKYTLNNDDERVAALKKYLDDNDLTNNNLWVPKSDITMLHAVNDDDVPYINSKTFYDNMYDPMKNNGYTLSLNSYANTSNIGHFLICFAWMISEVTGTSVDTLLNLMQLVQ